MLTVGEAIERLQQFRGDMPLKILVDADPAFLCEVIDFHMSEDGDYVEVMY